MRSVQTKSLAVILIYKYKFVKQSDPKVTLCIACDIVSA